MRNVLIGALVGFAVTFVVGTAVLRNVDDNLSEAPVATKTIQVTQTPSPISTPSETPTEDPFKADAKYGQTLQLPEGLKVTVLHPTPYPKDPSVKMLKKSYMMFTVTVKNTTKTAFPRTEDWFIDSGTGKLGNWMPGNSEYTATEGNGLPSGRLGAGAALTFTVVFGYDDTELPKFSFATCPVDEICRAYVWA